MLTTEIQEVIKEEVDRLNIPVHKHIRFLKNQVQTCKEYVHKLNIMILLATLCYNSLVTEGFITDFNLRSMVYILYVLFVLTGAVCYLFLCKELREEIEENELREIICKESGGEVTEGKEIS